MNSPSPVTSSGSSVTPQHSFPPQGHFEPHSQCLTHIEIVVDVMGLPDLISNQTVCIEEADASIPYPTVKQGHVGDRCTGVPGGLFCHVGQCEAIAIAFVRRHHVVAEFPQQSSGPQGKATVNALLRNAPGYAYAADHSFMLTDCGRQVVPAGKHNKIGVCEHKPIAGSYLCRDLEPSSERRQFKAFRIGRQVAIVFFQLLECRWRFGPWRDETDVIPSPCRRPLEYLDKRCRPVLATPHAHARAH